MITEGTNLLVLTISALHTVKTSVTEQHFIVLIICHIFIKVWIH